MAYSFVAKAPDDEEGIFLTSVDVFIQRKSSENGIWFEIREMDNAGGITNNTVPKSIKWFTPDQVPLSTDGKTNPLNVEFDEPLFLYNNVQYAFVIHTENIDPNYYIWITRLGEEDVTTGEQYVSRPMTGTFYTTNNNLNWDIVEDADLTCTFYRASFETNTTGTAYVGNEPVDKILLSDLSVSTLTNKRGESFYTSRLTVSGANGTINISQHYAQSNTSFINTNLSFAHSGTEYVVDKLGIAAGEQLNFYYSSNNVYTGISADVASTANARGYLTKYTATGGQKIMHLNKSSGGFKANDVIYCSTDNSIYATVDDILNYRYSVVNFDPSYIAPYKTSINFAMRTYSNTEVAGSYVNIDPAENYYYNDERALLSRSNEITNHSSDSSNKVQVTMYSTSEYVSPVFNLVRSSTTYVDNLINANTVGETAAATGSGYLWNKYISKTVTLAEGQDAEDLKLLLTSYRPQGTDVKVWCKLLNGEDEDTFANRDWIELEKSDVANATFSSTSDRFDFIEYEYYIPEANKDANGIFTYTNSQGVTFEGYKYFAIKIGLLGTNSAKVPRVADLRFIALQL